MIVELIVVSMFRLQHSENCYVVFFAKSNKG
jgi:hypothetical protein